MGSFRIVMVTAILAGLAFGCGGGGTAGTGGLADLPDAGGDAVPPAPPPPTPTAITAQEIALHPPYSTEFRRIDYATGLRVNDAAEPAVVDTHVVHVEDTHTLRLIFEETLLGPGSAVEVHCPLTGDTFELTAEVAEQTANTTIQFNGNTLELRLRLAPRSQGSYTLFGAFVGVVPIDQGPNVTICGPTDDRVASNDPRVARFNGNCSSWLTGTNNCLVTAGHCVSCLPAGFPSLVEFSVPASLPSGALVPAAARDQYFAVPATLQFVDANGCAVTTTPIPDDWAVMRVGPNLLGEVPNSRQGPGFAMDTSLPAVATYRITGYGTDTGTQNQTQQTHTGPDGGSAGFTVRYQVDTNPANSGSPVIDDSSGLVVGIHTGGGCADPVAGTSNAGVSVAYGPFQTALAAVCGKAAPLISCPPNLGVACNVDNGSMQSLQFPTSDPDAELVFVQFFVDGVLQGDDTVAGAGIAQFDFTFPTNGGVPYTVVALATNATGTQASCTFTVTVTDNPPMITCPADITAECAGPMGTQVAFNVTAVDDCTMTPTISCVVTSTPDALALPVGTPVTSPFTFPLGTTTVECTATDVLLQTDVCTFNVTIQDTTPPVVNALAQRPYLFLPRNGVLDALLQYGATDVCDPNPAISVEVFTNQADTGLPFSPDAAVLGPSLRLRAEVDLTAVDPGRVYLILVTATDASGNVGRDCTWAIVPKTVTVLDVLGARNIATAAEAVCDAGGGIPLGWFGVLPPTPLP